MAITYHAGRRLQGLAPADETYSNTTRTTGQTSYSSNGSTMTHYIGERFTATKWRNVELKTLVVYGSRFTTSSSGDFQLKVFGSDHVTQIGSTITGTPSVSSMPLNSAGVSNTTVTFDLTGITSPNTEFFIGVGTTSTGGAPSYVFYNNAAAGTDGSNMWEEYNGYTNFPSKSMSFTLTYVGGDTKPANVQVGSRYEETDTRKMYHYESPSVTFEDDFSSSPNGWTLGSGQTIESGYLYADGNDVLSSKPLAIGEPTNFIFDFDYAPVDGAPRITFVVLNSEIGGYGAASSGHKRIIFGLHQNGLSMDIRYRISGSSEVEVISIDSTVPPYDGTISYYRMIKTSGNVTVKRYASDANRTSDTSVSQTVSLDFTESGYSGTADLAYLVVGGKGSDASYSRNAKLYDFKFYSGVTSLDNVWSEEGT